MPLEPGTTLGPYRVTAKIGEGGMGEVYRARDTKLDRDVALKVLPQAFTDDPDRLARFEREAYPDLRSVDLETAPAQTFERALAAIEAMGWELVDEEAAAGRIEATATTFWFGFEDDVVVRIRPADGGSRVDVRSVSRVGRGDVGANARRIRAYVQHLTGE